VARINIPSLFWTLYDDLYVKLSDRLRVDMAILDYNYGRMLRCVQILAEERMRRFREKPHEVTLDITEYAIALEFYLQFDGKLLI
jgi:hypothetical protein